MDIPSTVNVAGVHYRVQEQSFIEIGGNRNYQGVCDYANTEIGILADLSQERKKQTFIHELTHAIFYEAGFEDQDEDMINRIGKVLFQVLEDQTF